MNMAVCSIFLMTLTLTGSANFTNGPASKDPVVQGKALSSWIKELKDPDPLTREEALAVLAGVKEDIRVATPVLLELLKDKTPPVRVKAAALLVQLKMHTKES